LIFSNQFQTYFEESKDVKKLTESEHFWKIGRQNVNETVARARFHINIAKKTAGIGAASDLRCRVPNNASAARTLVYSARRSCYSGLQAVVTKRTGTAARGKA